MKERNDLITKLGRIKTDIVAYKKDVLKYFVHLDYFKKLEVKTKDQAELDIMLKLRAEYQKEYEKLEKGKANTIKTVIKKVSSDEEEKQEMTKIKNRFEEDVAQLQISYDTKFKEIVASNRVAIEQDIEKRTKVVEKNKTEMKKLAATSKKVLTLRAPQEKKEKCISFR